MMGSLSRRVRRLEAKPRGEACPECAAREWRYVVSWAGEDEPSPERRCGRCGAALDVVYGIEFDDRT